MANEKLVFMVLHGPDEPEHATIPFVMACAALASEVEVVIGLQAGGVELGRVGGVDSVEAAGFPPLKKLVTDFHALGGRLLVCGPCLNSRAITPDQLVAGAEIVAAGRFIAEITSATNSLVY
ncbi:MAG: DsrE family protein [Candidatus Limnocylindrales bacterium]